MASRGMGHIAISVNERYIIDVTHQRHWLPYDEAPTQSPPAEAFAKMLRSLPLTSILLGRVGTVRQVHRVPFGGEQRRALAHPSRLVAMASDTKVCLPIRISIKPTKYLI